MRWNKREKAERPEYPKLVALRGSIEDARHHLPILRKSDPDATIVEGGTHGVYARVHNEEGEMAAKRLVEGASDPA